MDKVSTWIVKMTNNDLFELSSEEYEKLMSALASRGTNRPKWATEKQEWIFMEHISSIAPSVYISVPDEIHVEAEVEINTIKPEADPAVDKEAVTDEEKLQVLKDKSSCKHKEEDAVLHKQFVRTKKGMGLRYFPVCGFCGRRGRYIKTDSLSTEEKENAVEWVDKE